MHIAEELTENLPFAAATPKAFSAAPRSEVAAAVEPLVVVVSFDDQIAVYSCLHHWTNEQVVSLFAVVPALSVEPADDVEVVAVVAVVVAASPAAAAAANVVVVAVAAEAGFVEGLLVRRCDFGPEVAVAGVEPGQRLEVAAVDPGE